MDVSFLKKECFIGTFILILISITNVSSANTSGRSGYDMSLKQRQRRALEPLNVEPSRADLCDRSLCPWETDWHYDRDRIPSRLQYAVCTTNKCSYRSVSMGSRARRKLELETVCEQIKTEYRVVDVNGTEYWLTEWPIACVCATRSHVDVILPGPGNVRASDTEGYLSSVQNDVSPMFEFQLGSLEQARRHSTHVHGQRKEITFDEVMRRRRQY
ncbi:hypothetical protein DPMN_016363 [Dreissena polymorpha]|uniref:Uncharacterized protein n=1 Tax=Dreissena polymorpha TaxID=45954 RepID=A0A9D4N9K4_DREPO|nr:hypothetical protein DPMN_016363 [Dreissena polymorpha]